MPDSPKHGDKDTFACDGCGNGIETVYDSRLEDSKGRQGVWVGEFIITTDDAIKHPECLDTDDSLDQENADLFAKYLKSKVGG